MLINENFISKVCNAFKKAVESASEVTIEGREREFRHALARYLFDEILGWEGHSKIGEIYDITCYDDENFPVILVETKWGVELSREIKEKLKNRIEELGSVKYGVFASERNFILYEYSDSGLIEITKVNVAEAVGVAQGKYGLSEEGKKRIQKLELLKREQLIWVEEPEYFRKTYKEISLTKGDGVKLLTENLRVMVDDLTLVFMNFFESYWNRKDHSSGRFLENTFNDWLKISGREEEFKKDETRQRTIEVFCRETAYVLLGRLLFTRICEDKEIIDVIVSGEGIAEYLEYHGKRGAENVYLRLLTESREEIKKYYSHLHELGFFDWWIIEEVKKGALSHDEQVIQSNLERNLNYCIRKVLRRLNRFDFTNVDRDILGDVYQGYLPSDERKRLGEFYTPKEVIEYILDVVGYTPMNEIRGKKILDPACGSGGFLVEATRRLIERYKKMGFNFQDVDSVRQVIDGCINSIYGLDIHPFACFIAEINILFQLVDLYHIVRRQDRYYKLPRLNIYRTDSLMPASEALVLGGFFDNSRLLALIEEIKGANKVKNTKFDYVIGNPPYVRIHRLTEEQKREYEALYKSAKGLYDIFCLFIEKGICLLKDGGKLGYICSNRFMTRGYGENLRKILSTPPYALKHIVDFGDSGVFEEVTNYPSIIVIERSTEPFKGTIKCVRVYAPKENLLQDIREHLQEKRWRDQAYEIFEMSYERLSEKVWILLPQEEEGLIAKINTTVNYRLQDLVEGIQVGVQTGADEIFVINEDTVFGKRFEQNIVRKFLKGEDVRRWLPTWRGYFLIYPYTIKNGQVHLYSIDEVKKIAPNIWNYLSKFKDKLSKRWGVKEVFYELPTVRRPDWFEKEKIITPDIANKNNFAYDDEGFYFSKGTVYGILLKDEYKKFTKYILGLLNSKLLEFYFKHISPMHAGGYFRYNTQYLAKLPIKLPTNPVEESLCNEINEKVTQILELKSQTIHIERKIKQFPNSYFEDDWDFDKLSNLIKSQSITRESYSLSAKSLRTDYRLRDLDGKETFRIILSSNEYLDFFSEDVASYVYEVLKTMNRITKRELLEMIIPTQPYLKSILNHYRKDKEQIIKNEKAVEELEKQIDDLVYKLYNINGVERRIIEEYLKKY